MANPGRGTVSQMEGQSSTLMELNSGDGKEVSESDRVEEKVEFRESSRDSRKKVRKEIL